MGHRRAPSASSISSRTTTTTTSTSTAPSTTTTTAPLPNRDPSLPRPAFNSFQQHFSPAKSLAPKPLTASFLAPPSPSKLPANVQASAETARLQTELLQLHLLHRDSGKIDEAWRASARKQLAERFARLAAEEGRVVRLEGEVAEREGAGALVAWGGGAGGVGVKKLDEKVQALDQILAGLWALSEPGSKYSRVVRKFEGWAGELANVLETRRRHRDDDDHLGAEEDDEGLALLADLGQPWRDEVLSITRRLEEWSRTLDELGQVFVMPAAADDDAEAPQEGSGGGGGGATALETILNACGRLVEDMLEELAAMENMEREAAEEERRWIREMVRRMDDDEEVHGLGGKRVEREGDTQRAGAIWRAL